MYIPKITSISKNISTNATLNTNRYIQKQSQATIQPTYIATPKNKFCVSSGVAVHDMINHIYFTYGEIYYINMERKIVMMCSYNAKNPLEAITMKLENG